MSRITYKCLFTYLRSLGFREISPSEFERAFEHPEHGIVLTISMLGDASEDRIARDADVLSAQFQLQQHGLLEGELIEVAVQNVKE